MGNYLNYNEKTLSLAKYKRYISFQNYFQQWRRVHGTARPPLVGLMTPQVWGWMWSQEVSHTGGQLSHSPPWCKPAAPPRSPQGTVGIRCTAPPWCSPGSTYRWPCYRGGPESPRGSGRTGSECTCTLWGKGREKAEQSPSRRRCCN